MSYLGKVAIPLQIDIGTGDIVTPQACFTQFATLIKDLPAPELLVYSRETAVAEKLEAMVKLDLANSRMKDFYDVWVILMQLGYDKDLLRKSIHATFNRRNTSLPEGEIPALTSYFYKNANKEIQWKAFLRKSRLMHRGIRLGEVCIDIQNVLNRVL